SLVVHSSHSSFGCARYVRSTTVFDWLLAFILVTPWVWFCELSAFLRARRRSGRGAPPTSCGTAQANCPAHENVPASANRNVVAQPAASKRSRLHGGCANAVKHRIGESRPAQRYR